MKEPLDEPLPNEKLRLLRDLLRADGWDPRLIADGETFVMQYAGRGEEFAVYAGLPDRVADVLVCYSQCPFFLQPQSFAQAGEFINRVNYGLLVGNFEISLEYGEVRFRSSVDFKDLELTSKLVRNVLHPCAYVMSLYLPSFQALQAENATWQEALNRVSQT